MIKKMRPEEKQDVTYATMRVSDLRVGRRGKHHELLAGILKNLDNLPAGSALVVPLDSIGKVSLANLRSAVSRSAKGRGLSVLTYSDEKNFYVWNKALAAAKPPAGRKVRK
jgi:hypothetical protein